MTKDTFSNNPFANLKRKEFPDKPLNKSDKPLYQKTKLIPVPKPSTKNIDSPLQEEQFDDALFFANMASVEKLNVRKENKKGKSTKANPKHNFSIPNTPLKEENSVETTKEVPLLAKENKPKESVSVYSTENTVKKDSAKQSFSSFQSLKASLPKEEIKEEKELAEKMPAMQKNTVLIKEEKPIKKEDDSDENIFLSAVSDVKGLEGKGRDVQPEAVLQEKPTPSANLIQDEFAEKLTFALHSSEEYIEAHVLGLDLLTVGKLQAREYKPEAHIDLHGLTAEQAYHNLIAFFRNAYHRSLRSVLIVTGKGKNSPTGNAILREKTCEWLTKDPFKRAVLAFCSAKEQDGGAGALYVLIRKPKKDFGAINWDMMSTDPEMFL